MRKILLAAGVFTAGLLGASAASATVVNLCTEDSVRGCVQTLPVTGSTITVASDGESPFDPFGYGHDTSDGLQLDGIWVGLRTNGWDQIAGTNTWVLSSCDSHGTCENGNVREPIGQWIAPGYTLVVPPITFLIFEPDGTLSDKIRLFNNSDGIVNITFNSGAVPEPAAWAVMLAGFGIAGAALRRRRAVVA